MRGLCIPLALIALAGCDQPETATEGQQSTKMADAPLTNGEENASGGEATPVPLTPGQTGASSAQSARLETIPARFRGVWDYEQGSCNPASDLRLEIGADEIVFYESMGEVEQVTRGENGMAIVRLAMSGEGETWRSTSRLELLDSGERLLIRDVGRSEIQPTDYRRKCSS